MGEVIYLDYNATTPVAAGVADAMDQAVRGVWGNPSSPHSVGRVAKAALQRAREAVAGFLDTAPAQLTFTSGATEADNLAIESIAASGGPGTQRDHFVCPRIEHPAIVAACKRLEAQGWSGTWLDADRSGRVEPAAVAAAVSDRTALVAMMAANNETGVVQPVRETVEVAHAVGARVVCDAVQVTGKLPMAEVMAWGADYITITAHKMYGPKGIGALWCAQACPVVAQMVGGTQERGHRGGTEAVAQAVGLAAACQWVAEHPGAGVNRVQELRDRLESEVTGAISDVRVNGQSGPRLANTSNLYFAGVMADSLAVALDLEGVCVSAGSACHSGAANPSGVLLAMGLSQEEALGSARISLGHDTRPEDIDRFLAILPKVVERLRAAG